MELIDLVYLGTCTLLAPEVRVNGIAQAADPNRIKKAIELAQAVWQEIVDKGIR